MQKITPCLLFNHRIEEAMNFYVSVFKGSIKSVSRLEDGSVLVAVIEILGHDFMLLTGGPRTQFTEAISFSVDCKDQAEVDYYWDALTADGGEESMCAWLRDKYGISWQIVPETLPRLLNGSDKQGAQRAMQAMMGMRKIDVAEIERAYAG